MTRPKFELKTDAYPIHAAVTDEPERITPLVYLVGQIVAGNVVGFRRLMDCGDVGLVVNAAELLLVEIKKREAAK